MKRTRTLPFNLRLFGLVLCGLFLSPYSYSQEVIPEVETVIREGLLYHQSPTEPFTGVVETSYRKGQLRRRGSYIDGKQEGLWEEFYRNGQLRRRGSYKDGERDGLWEYFGRKGSLATTRTYRNGELVETNENP